MSNISISPNASGTGTFTLKQPKIDVNYTVNLPERAGVLTAADSTTGAVFLPLGTTAQRPASPVAGMIRHNTTSGFVETYNGSSWEAVGDQTNFYSVEYLVVAGGASGGAATGSFRGGGGGGGGGFLEGTTQVQIGTAYTVTVGGGGASRPVGSSGISGGNSNIGSLVVALGGGGGGTGTNGSAGGSGGGAGDQTGAQSGGAGTTGQGFRGGNTGGSGGNGNGGAGGGGANSQGVDGSQTSGGSGKTSSINGNTYAAGGSGGSRASSETGTSKAANTAGGGNGGGGSSGGGGAGGSGIVVLRYLGSQRGTGGTVTSSGGYTVHTFTASATYTA